MQQGLRVTVAMMYVLPEHSRLMVVERLLHRVEQHGVRIKVLYLDKGFCSGSIIQYLQHRRQATIMACPIRGKQGGTRALCRGRGSYRTSYTFSDGTQVDMAVVLTKPLGQDDKRRRKWLLYVTIGVSWPQKRSNDAIDTASVWKPATVRCVACASSPPIAILPYAFSCMV